MRMLYLEGNDQETKNKLFDELYILVKEGKFFNYFATGKITFCKWEEDGKQHLAVTMNDCVPATFTVTTCEQGVLGGITHYHKVETEAFAGDLQVPKEWKVSVVWDEEKKKR